MAAPKVRVPAPHPALVPRERLLRLLSTESATRDGAGVVRLVCAPAGSGKTTLLSAWAHTLRSAPTRARRRGGRPGDGQVAWVSVDTDDNNVFLLWSAILAGLEETGAFPPDSPLYRLSPPRRDVERGFLAAVVAVIDALSEPVWLVLDDVHELRDPAALHSLDLLLRNLPRKLRPVLSARFEPPLNLHRLRLDGMLREIGTGHLMFTREEAALLLAAHEVQLTDADLDLLLERTEGWAAGLRLAAMSLVDATDPAALIADFIGDDCAVADYLVAEILSRQPAHIRRFLLATSVCAEFAVELAGALSGRDDAGEILDRLERANALVTRLDQAGHWYRFHPLLRGYLRAELARRDASALPRLHGVAARWFAANGAPARALEHAVAAADSDLISRLVERSGLQQVMSGEGAPLRRLLDEVPPQVLASPGVALVAAAAALDVGDVTTAEARLEHMGVGIDEHRNARLRALHATVAVHRARLGGDIGAAMAALENTPAADTGDPDLDLLALVNRGTALLWLDDHDAGERDLHRALALATARHRDSVALHCLVHLAAVAAADADFVGMAERADAAIAFAAERGWAHTSRCAYAYGMAAWAAHQRLDDEAAHRFAPLAVELLEGQTDPNVELTARSLAAIVGFDAAEDRHAVVAGLREHWLRLAGGQLAPSLVAYVAPVHQRLALRVGELAWAADVAERVRRLLGGATAESHLLRAVLNVQKGRVEDARALLRPALDGELRHHLATTLIDAWLLEAVLADRAGDRYRAHQALGEAVRLAAPRRALRPFVDGGEPVRALLAGGAGRFGRHEDFAAEARAALPPQVPGATDVLTARELELLAELPSMRTAEEIAASLLVSVNTVKTHLRGIYQKLGVNNRRQAISVARRRGLL